MKFLQLSAFTLTALMVFSACNSDDDPEPFKGPLTLGPTANFYIQNQSNSPIAPATFTFVNQSSNSTSYIWDFGDGSPVSTAATASVTHTYQSGGTFTVTLTAKGAEGSTATKALEVVVLPTPPQIALITARPYKLTGMTYSYFGGPVQNVFADLNPCHHDDLFKFETDGSFEVQEGNNACAPFESWAGNGHWYFSSGYNFINIQGNAIYIDGEVTTLNSTTLVLERSSGNDTYSYTFTAQ